MLTLVWRDTAIRQLEEIVAYISKENLDAALRLRQMVAHCAERLPAHPYMYRRGRVSSTREAVITPNYFLVIASPPKQSRLSGSRTRDGNTPEPHSAVQPPPSE